MRPVCDLHDCSQIKMPFGNAFLIQDMEDWWYGLLSYACVLHIFQRENTYAKLHENAPFEMKNYKNFLGRGTAPSPVPPPPVRGILPPGLNPPWRLDARAHGQLPRISSDPRNAPGFSEFGEYY